MLAVYSLDDDPDLPAVMGAPPGMTTDDQTDWDLPLHLPPEVRQAVEAALGEVVTVIGPLAGGLQGGALKLAVGNGEVVAKFATIAHPNHLAGWQRAARLMTSLRQVGYPTPAWLGLGTAGPWIWQLLEYVPARPAAELNDAMVMAVMDAVELQADLADGPDNWSGFVHQVGTGRHPDFAHLSGYSTEVAELISQLGADTTDAQVLGAPDAVHGDLSAGNLLFDGTRLMGIVDACSAAAGHRAIDLTTLLWYSFTPAAAIARQALRRRIIDLVGWPAAAVLLSCLVQNMLAFPMARGRHEIVAGVIRRAQTARAELHSER